MALHTQQKCKYKNWSVFQADCNQEKQQNIQLFFSLGTFPLQ